MKVRGSDPSALKLNPRYYLNLFPKIRRRCCSIEKRCEECHGSVGGEGGGLKIPLKTSEALTRKKVLVSMNE